MSSPCLNLASPVTVFLFPPKLRGFSLERFITNTNFYGLNHNIGIFMYTCFCCLTLLIEPKLCEGNFMGILFTHNLEQCLTHSEQHVLPHVEWTTEQNDWVISITYMYIYKHRVQNFNGRIYNYLYSSFFHHFFVYVVHFFTSLQNRLWPNTSVCNLYICNAFSLWRYFFWVVIKSLSK